MLQGRNFSYLDTQLKRLGGPNFTHLPVNAPRCPFATFQQDGHMAMTNPKGRVNYEPNSWGVGPREDPVRGYNHFASTETGEKRQIRPASFADHYSQARQFYVSQTRVEQKHIGDALVFELSKCERPDIRARMVSHLRNIDEGLASTVANGLGLIKLPDPAPPAVAPVTDLPPSDPLSIVKRAPASFRGRKIGVLLTDGASAEVFDALLAAATAEGALLEVVAPKVGGATLDNGKLIVAKQKIDGGPSVLYDAVALVLSAEGAALLAIDKPAKDFVSDAFAHCKFIGYTAQATFLFEKAGLTPDDLDEGVIGLASAADAEGFVTACRKVRVWARETAVDLDARA
jgi:catalase